MSFGERIKARREELQIKQEDVAGYINENLSHQAVGKWERDESYPQVEKLLLLAVKLDMSLDDMFADELAISKDFFDNAIDVSEWNMDKSLSDHKGSVIEIGF